MATGRSEAGDASVMLDRYYGHGMGVISWPGRPSSSVGEPCGGFGNDPATRLLLPSSTATATATNPTTTFHLHNVEGRPYESEASRSIH